MKVPSNGAIAIINWAKFQHYSGRRQIWVKFYLDILDDYNYCQLHDDCKLLLHHLWLLASCYQNAIPHDLKYLRKKLPLNEKKINESNLECLQVAGFIELPPASKTLATFYQDASLDKSRVDKSRVDKKREEVEQAQQVILLFNKITGKDFKIVQANTKHVIARIREGYNMDDFETVIGFKNNEWRNKDEMKQFIRPETVLGAKFEGYRVIAWEWRRKQEAQI